MRIKSILALSVFAATTLFSGVSSADSLKPAASQKYHRHSPYASSYEISDSNFLVGGSFGYEVTRADFTTTFTAPGLALPITGLVSHEEKVVNQQTLFGLLLGWQHRCYRWMFGVEGSVDFPSLEKNRPILYAVNSAGATVNYVNGTVLYERGNVYALTARAGYFVTPFFMPYIRAGAQMSQDELTYQAFLGGGTPGVLGAAQRNDFVSKKKDIYGVVTGVGAEFPAYIGPSTFRIEYNFIWTQSLEIAEANSIFSATHKFRRPVSHVGKFSWVWNFL